MKALKLIFILFFVHQCQLHAQICFSDNPINYSLNTGYFYLKGVDVGNFSADAIPDIVIGVNSDVIVKVSNGLGGFSSNVVYNIGGAKDLLVSDMENDGFEDVVVINSGGDLVVLYNQSNGTLTDSLYNTSSFFGNGKMFVEDLNNDGFNDVVMLSYSASSTIFMNGGSRNFTAQTLTLPYNPDAACIGFWNSDTLPDILVTDAGILTPLIGNGNGTFTQSTGLPFSGVSQVRVLYLTDMNNDSFTDVIAGGAIDLTLHYRNASGNITSTSQVITQVDVDEYLNPDDILVADLDQDQYPEVIMPSQWNYSVAVIKNVNGILSLNEYACTGGAGYVALKDMDLDGFEDIVVASSGANGYISFLMGKASSKFEGNEYLHSGHATGLDLETLATGDVNGDGFKDLVTYGYDTVLVHLNNGSGAFSSAGKFAILPSGTYTSPVLLEDFTNDGNLDVIVADNTQKFYLLSGQGNGNFLPPVIIAAPGYTWVYAMVAGKFNNDTIPDIAYNSNGSIKFLINNGNGTFSQGSTIPPMAGNAIGMSVGDFNEDGSDDLAFTTNNTSGSLLLNNGNGVFSIGSTLFNCTNGTMAAVACGDINNDGHLDVAFTDYSCSPQGRVVLYYGNGTGTLTSGGTLPVFVSPYHLAIADIDLDGYNDLITNSYPGFFNVFLFDISSSTLSSPLFLASGSVSAAFVVEDFNNDQKPDLAFNNKYSSDIGVTLNSIIPVYPNLPNHYVCPGDSTLLYITDSVPGFVWSNGSTNDSIYVKGPGWYYVTFPSSAFGGCFSSTRVLMQPHFVIPPVFSAALNPDTLCTNQVGSLQATPAGGTFTGPGVSNNQFNPSSLTAGISYTISYSYMDSTGCSSLPVSISIYVDPCTGMTESEIEKIKLSPNPAMSDVEINQGNTIIYDHLQVYDMYGRVVDERVIQSVKMNVSVQELVPGAYQFRFFNSSNRFPSFSKRVLVQH
jgi:hypothetical protein